MKDGNIAIIVIAIVAILIHIIGCTLLLRHHRAWPCIGRQPGYVAAITVVYIIWTLIHLLRQITTQFSCILYTWTFSITLTVSIQFRPTTI